MRYIHTFILLVTSQLLASCISLDSSGDYNALEKIPLQSVDKNAIVGVWYGKTDAGNMFQNNSFVKEVLYIYLSQRER